MKKALIISISINLILVVGWAGKRLYYSNSAPSTTDYASNINREKCGIFSNLPVAKGDIVLIGNSITERFPANEMFGSLKIRNRGIGSNLTRHVLERIGSIAAQGPDKIFIEAGINDLAQKVPMDTIVSNFIQTINLIHGTSPHTRVFVQSIMPTTGPDKYLMPAIIKLNERLKDICTSEGANLVDMFDPFEIDGQMNKDLTTDGTHLNYVGYQKYKAILDLYINS